MRLSSKDLIPNQVKLTKSLVERAEKMSVEFHIPLAQLVREGLDMKLTELEKRIEDRANRQKQKVLDEKQALLGHHLLGMRPVGNIPRMGQPMTQPITTPFSERTPYKRPVQSDDDAFLVKLAQSVLDAGTDREEMSRRAIAAVAAYKRQHPLLAPSDPDILKLLEQRIIMLREQGVSPVRTVDSLVGAVLDVSKMKTAGAVDNDDG